MPSTVDNVISINESKKLPVQSTTSSDAIQQQRPQRILQNFVLLWLDVNLNERSEKFRCSHADLQRVVNCTEVFLDADSCIDYLIGIINEKIFMVICDSLGKIIVPIIHEFIQLDTILVFCDKAAEQKHWTKKWPKVKGIFTEIPPLCEYLQTATRRCDQDTITLSFASMNSTTPSKLNLDKLDQSFMYTQLLKDILLEINDFGPQAIQDFAQYCREQHVNSSDIEKFEREYGNYTPIWWYTAPYFLYSMLNRALRTLEVDMILKMSFFIRDLQRYIQQTHSKQSINQQQCFTVYRGQGLSKKDFEKMLKMKGGLIAFNNFLSTSKDRDISFAFADSNYYNPDLVGIFFEISVDSSNSSAPFAYVSIGMSYFSTEEEVLFSMHTIFRIDEIKQIEGNNRLWHVKLTVTNDNDQQLRILTEQIREDLGETAGWSRLGILLGKLGQSDKAEQVYRMLLDQTVDDNEKATLHNNLGYSKSEQGEYEEAIQFLSKGLEIIEKAPVLDNPNLSTLYGNFGSVYDKIGAYTKALSFYEKALEIRERSLPSNHPKLAILYTNISSVYEKMGEYSRALSFYEKALAIQQNSFPPNHPDLATSYSNIGLLYETMGEYSKSLLFYEKALEIREEALPLHHPDMATSYACIGSVHIRMSQYSKALSFYEKAVEIYLKVLNPNHPNLATAYDKIGLIYNHIGNYSTALSFYQNALRIREKVLPSDHPNLAQSYNKIGITYDSMGDYSNALSFSEKALAIRQKTLPSNHLDLAESYNNIGALHDNAREYLKALSYYEKALEIHQRILSSNHPNLATSYSNIGLVYTNLKQYSKALLFTEKAFEIREKVLDPNHLDLAASYNNIGLIYDDMSQYSTALWFYEKANNIFENSLSPNHPSLAISYYNIGVTYKNLGHYLKAFTFCERAFEAGLGSLPANHPHLTMFQNELEYIKTKL